jgi:prepilin-type N-terminal cleavage/methylation domain-containing protein
MKSEVRNRKSSTGFTLVELLVVIAVIVVLLALLAPALDKAVYQAELVRCSGNVKAMTNGGLLYASGNRRHYPSAELRNIPGFSPDLVGRGNHPASDLRPVFDRASIPWQKLLLCPLSGGIDLSHEANEPGTLVLANYALFFGWQYEGYRRMNKLGDEFTAPDPQSLARTGTTMERSFKVLVADKHLEHWPAGSRQSPHPDRLNAADHAIYQNQPPNPTVEIEGVLVNGENYTLSRWNAGPGKRGPHDLNFGMTDGSVIRLEAVAVHDERLTSAPHRYGPVTYNHPWGLRLPQ